ncbi:MAG: SURF1 family protein [Catenulisporales bacterium]|nr:SURF1 family protein [Catenulisporales bacterium]
MGSWWAMKYRFLLRPGWLAAIAALVALTAAFVGLGMWQFSRAHRTHKLSAQELTARATVVPLAQLLKDGSPANGALGHAVTVSGVLDGTRQLLVPDRALPDGRDGYLVIAPLKAADGTAVVVSRGWTAQPVTPPPVPAGPVTITGWLAAAEPADSASAKAEDDAAKDPAHRIATVDVATLVNTWPYPLDQSYVNALSINPADDAAVKLTPVPAPTPPNKSSWYILNLGYTLQWWVFGIVGLWWFATYVRRLANPAAEDAEEEAAQEEDSEEEDAEELSPPAQAPAATP